MVPRSSHAAPSFYHLSRVILAAPHKFIRSAQPGHLFCRELQAEADTQGLSLFPGRPHLGQDWTKMPQSFAPELPSFLHLVSFYLSLKDTVVAANCRGRRHGALGEQISGTWISPRAHPQLCILCPL